MRLNNGQHSVAVKRVVRQRGANAIKHTRIAVSALNANHVKTHIRMVNVLIHYVQVSFKCKSCENPHQNGKCSDPLCTINVTQVINNQFPVLSTVENTPGLTSVTEIHVYDDTAGESDTSDCCIRNELRNAKLAHQVWMSVTRFILGLFCIKI